MSENKVHVILDTNFLLIPGQYKVDIFHSLEFLMTKPFEFCIFDATIDELMKIASKNVKDKNNAKIALQLIKQKNLKSLHNSFIGEDSYIDKIILNNAQDSDIICTQDKDLKRLIKKKSKKIRIITLMDKKHIEFEV